MQKMCRNVGKLKEGLDMGEIICICLLAVIVIVGTIYFIASYIDESNHRRDMRRQARGCRRDIRDNTNAIKDACLESMRRDGYMFRRGSK